MSSTSKLVMERHVLRYWLAALMTVAACKAGVGGGDPDASLCTPSATAPTYTQLYTKYFATGTPGHCGDAACHDVEASGTGWVCGTTKDTCYSGMLGIELIAPLAPKASRIADPKNSPLSWINPNGAMPNDNPMPFPEGRDAILAWVAACAQNN